MAVEQQPLLSTASSFQRLPGHSIERHGELFFFVARKVGIWRRLESSADRQERKISIRQGDSFIVTHRRTDRIDREPQSTERNWYREQRHALIRLGNLMPNWNSYGADPPHPKTIGTARRLLKALRDIDLSPTKVLASAEGGVGIIFDEPGRYAVIECLNSGDIVALIARGDDEPDVWEVRDDKPDLLQASERIHGFMYG